MLGWGLVGLGLAILVAAVRIAGRGARGATQGVGALLTAIGGILLLRRPGSGIQLPGYGPRQWRQP
jgi:hypothetical protein